MRTLTPEDSICWAIVFIFAAEAFAFWMLQFSLYFTQLALSAVGSAVIHRGDEVVSGRMMPTFAFLPSIAPPAPLLAGADDDAVEDPAVDEPAAAVDLPLPLPPLELQAASANSETPTAATDTVVLRIFTPSEVVGRGAGSRSEPATRPPNVVCANISSGAPERTLLIQIRYRPMTA
jgi:hypothetical protein